MVELRLYIAGQTPSPAAAFANLKKLCEEHLPGRYKIEVIDLLEHPQLAAGDQIVAVPRRCENAAGTATPGRGSPTPNALWSGCNCGP